MSSIYSLSSDYRSLVYEALYGSGDSDKSGSLSSEELGASLTDIENTLGNSTLDADTLFEDMDKDSDGTVSLSEYKAGLDAVVDGTNTVSGTDATYERNQVLSSYLNGVQYSTTTTLLSGESDSGTDYSSLEDVVSLLRKQYNLSSYYTANGSTAYSADYVGLLLNVTA